ncbi:MAG: calcium/sodium antiporter [Rikenellaceae bacterium]|nr:calcium/sodium antiporter [Rikenellaceae bacterium]
MEYIYLLLCLAAIVFSADWLVAGAVTIAKRFKISNFVIGAVIVGVGTSFPELVVSSIGAIEGSSDIAIGNVVGSNIFNVLGILGLTAFIMPVAVSRENKRFDLPFCIGVSALTLLLAFNFFTGGAAEIGRIDGLVLLCCFSLFMYYSLKGGMEDEASDAAAEVVTNKQLVLGIGKVFLGLGVLLVSSRIFLNNAILVAKAWGVNEAFIAITLVACGTSLPELAASLVAAAKKNTQLALGNVIGSNIFNLTLILGLASQITPLTGVGITVIDYAVMIFATIAPLLLGFRGRLNRWAGAFLFLCFVAYNAYLIYSQIN